MSERTAKTRTTTVKFTDEQHRVISQRAERCGMRTATWIRAIVIQAATKPANDGLLRIKEPDGGLS